MVVGDGDLYAPLLKMVAEHDAGEKIILTGKVPYEEVPSYVAAADICLLPAYRNEIMMNIVPIKIYEYMAMGKPVIATTLPGLIQEFGFGNGISYVDSAEDVVTKAREMIERDVVGEEGKKASALVSGCDWETITDAFEGQLNVLIQNRRRNRSYITQI